MFENQCKNRNFLEKYKILMLMKEEKMNRSIAVKKLKLQLNTSKKTVLYMNYTKVPKNRYSNYILFVSENRK